MGCSGNVFFRSVTGIGAGPPLRSFRPLPRHHGPTTSSEHFHLIRTHLRQCTLCILPVHSFSLPNFIGSAKWSLPSSSSLGAAPRSPCPRLQSRQSHCSASTAVCLPTTGALCSENSLAAARFACGGERASCRPRVLIRPPSPPRPLFPSRRWNAIVSAKWGEPANTYVATNARFYKYFEHWAFGKGISVSHIVNSGRSLGDSR